MTIPVITFFNNKGGVGKTSLVYHLSWMMAELGKRVVAADLDPQANLTAAFLDEAPLEELWGETSAARASLSIHEAIAPLARVGDIQEARPCAIAPGLALVPGDLRLSGFEGRLSEEWPKALDAGPERYRTYRVLTAFWTVMQQAAAGFCADVILADVGPNLGAINRSALIAADHVVVPLAPDLFSLQGLRNLGPTLRNWRAQWQQRREAWRNPEFELPSGAMAPVGYIVQQHSVRLNRPVMAYDKWMRRIPETYGREVLESAPPFTPTPADDPHCLATLKHYRSLMAMAHEAHKPIFQLTSADGAIGGHSASVSDAATDYRALARTIMQRVGLPSAAQGRP